MADEKTITLSNEEREAIKRQLEEQQLDENKEDDPQENH